MTSFSRTAGWVRSAVRITMACALAVVAYLALTVAIDAQKHKPAPSSQQGTAEFRCSFNLPGCTTGDKILGDGGDYHGIGAAETGEGAQLNANREMWIGVGSGLYEFQLDFPPPAGVPPCQLTGNCRLPSQSVLIDQENAEFQSNVLGPDDGSQPTGNGLLDIPITPTPTTWQSRLKISFADPLGRSLLWGLNFNTIDYAGATNVNVTRTNGCTWVFEPAPGDRGGLSSYGSTGKGKSTRTDEGLYDMPFRITFRVPGLCA